MIMGRYNATLIYPPKLEWKAVEFVTRITHRVWPVEHEYTSGAIEFTSVYSGVPVDVISTSVCPSVLYATLIYPPKLEWKAVVVIIVW
jgi:hypothetical protein